tara:strand:+ start:655 stop:885 length:231 start_codon:yes stop_codon:yes gene_type:complete
VEPKTTTTEALVGEAQRLTQELRDYQEGMANTGRVRRALWQVLNDRGISQKRIADACGVVEHTVYTELRKHREAAA